MSAALGLLGRAAPKGTQSPLNHPVTVPPRDTHHVTQVVHGQLKGVDAQRMLQVVGVDILEVLLPDQPPRHLIRLHHRMRWHREEGSCPCPPPPPPWGHQPQPHEDITRVVPSSLPAIPQELVPFCRALPYLTVVLLTIGFLP